MRSSFHSTPSAAPAPSSNPSLPRSLLASASPRQQIPEIYRFITIRSSKMPRDSSSHLGRPVLISHNAGDCGARYIEHLPQAALADSALCVQHTDAAYLLPCQFGAAMPLASKATPTLSIHVVDVVLLRTQKKMRWVDAVTHIARVANLQPSRDWAVVDDPRMPVSIFSSTVHPESAIPSLKQRRHPQPASARLPYLGPEGNGGVVVSSGSASNHHRVIVPPVSSSLKNAA